MMLPAEAWQTPTPEQIAASQAKAREKQERLQRLARELVKRGIRGVWDPKAEIALKDLGVVSYSEMDELAWELFRVRALGAVRNIETTHAVAEALNEIIVADRRPSEPKAVDLRCLAALANGRNCNKPKGVSNYAAEKGCKAQLHLKAAVLATTSQESYADHSTYLVPVTIQRSADLDVCRRNLGLFAASLRTHTGMAGSGCTWSASLHRNEHGFYVVMECRASIAD